MKSSERFYSAVNSNMSFKTANNSAYDTTRFADDNEENNEN